MIYVVIYLVIAAAKSLYLPVARHRAAEMARSVPPEKLAAMTPQQRKAYDFMVSTTTVRMKPWHSIIVGLLWPLQIVIITYGLVLGGRINKRAATVQKFRSPCPGCARNLVGLDGTDAVEDRDTDRIRFVCGACATISDWRFSENGSTFLGRIGVAKSL